jgi:hypothetical protein
MLAAINEGHPDLADVLFLIAAILFLGAALIAAAGDSVKFSPKLNLIALGLCLVAVGWFVL